ncbi:unnamed protein product [Boreogadus saida]
MFHAKQMVAVLVPNLVSPGLDVRHMPDLLMEASRCFYGQGLKFDCYSRAAVRSAMLDSSRMLISHHFTSQKQPKQGSDYGASSGALLHQNPPPL